MSIVKNKLCVDDLDCRFAKVINNSFIVEVIIDSKEFSVNCKFIECTYASCHNDSGSDFTESGLKAFLQSIGFDATMIDDCEDKIQEKIGGYRRKKRVL